MSLKRLTEMRKAEGEKLAQDTLQRCEILNNLLNEVEKYSDTIVDEYREKLNTRINEILDFVELADRADDKSRKYSGGMKRRLMIGMALLHKPKILFLDEPTVGLDPQVRRKMWDLIRKMNEDGMTVLLTTHYIEEADHLCERVAVMNKGRLVAVDTPQKLKEKVGRVVVEHMESEGMINKFFDSREQAASYVTALKTNAIVRDANLEDVFIELTGRRVND